MLSVARRIALISLVIGVLADSAVLAATTTTWTSASNTTFSTAGNWSGGVPADDLTSSLAAFSTGALVNPVLTASRSIAGLSFTASGYTLSATNGAVLTLGASGITNASNITTTISAPLAGTGAITNSGVLTLSGANTFSGGTTLVASNSRLNIASASALGAGALSFNGATTLLDNTSGADLTLTTNNAVNLNSTTQLTFVGTHNLNLGTGAVTLSGNRFINVTTKTLTLGGAIGDGGNGYNLFKDGTGTLALSGASTYTGSTTIRLGTLSVTSIGNLGAPSALGAPTTVASGTINIGNTLDVATLSYTGPAMSTNRVVNLSGTTGGATLDGSGTGALTLTSSFTATGAGSKTLTLTGTTAGNTIEGAIVNNSGTNTTSLSKSGTGSWILSGTNTYTGGTSITAGTLQIGNGGTTGALSTSSTITISNTATLAFNRSDTVTQGTDFRSSISSGSGGLTQLGSGKLILNGANIYTGPTTVTAGTLQLAIQAALYNNNTANWTAAKLSIATGATLAVNVGGLNEFTSANLDTLKALGNGSGGGFQSGSFLGIDTTNAAGGTFTYNSSIANPNSGANSLGLAKLGTGTLVLGGTNTYSGDTQVLAGTLRLGSANALSPNTRLTIAAGATFDPGSVALQIATLSGTGNMVIGSSGLTLALTGGGTSTFNGTLSGSGSLTLTGSGTQVLGGTNSYDGATTVSSGVLQIDANSALGSSLGSTTISNGAALRLSNVSYTNAEAISLNGSGASGGGALVNSGTSTFAGSITAATNATISAGSGTLTLTGGLIKNGTVLTLSGGGQINVSGTGISGSSPNSDLVVDGTTLVLSANSSYNGPTTVQNNGTLVVNAQLTGNGNVAISGNSKLSGTGRVDAGSNHFIYIDGTLQIGDSRLSTTIASSLELATSGSGSTVLGSISGTLFDLFSGAGGGNSTGNLAAADRIKLFGSLDVTSGGTLILGNPSGLTDFAPGDAWRLIDFSGGGSLTNSWSSINYSALNLAPTYAARLDSSTGILSIYVTPEPSRALLLLTGAFGLLLRRRRIDKPLR